MSKLSETLFITCVKFPGGIMPVFVDTVTLVFCTGGGGSFCSVDDVNHDVREVVTQLEAMGVTVLRYWDKGGGWRCQPYPIYSFSDPFT